MTTYPRDLAGCGATPPDARWPRGAQLALQIVVYYEEGSEYTILDGDGRTEVGLAEAPGGRTPKDVRDLAMESMYEYGAGSGHSRGGFNCRRPVRALTPGLPRAQSPRTGGGSRLPLHCASPDRPGPGVTVIPHRRQP